MEENASRALEMRSLMDTMHLAIAEERSERVWMDIHVITAFVSEKPEGRRSCISDRI